MSATPAVSLLRGAEADAAIRDAGFIARWLTLAGRCSYATAFQRPEFACPWYSTYRQEWEPMLLLAQDTSGDLTGLWLLAWNQQERALVHAGVHQAEYHTWLATAGQEASFLKRAWTELKRNLSFEQLHFHYLPNADLAALLKSTLGPVTVRERRRPLLRLDADSIRASLAKKKTRYRFNRLSRLGPLEFRRIVDLDEFGRVFDELIDFYDFRQGATHQVTPFRRDLLKRDFHLALFAAAQERVVIAVTYLAGRPIAGSWSLASEGQAHLGMVIHSPFLAEHSPGILHFMQLSEYLSQHGMALIDLTPGGDAWKQRFANDYDRVASAVLHASHWRWWSDESRARLAAGVKRILRTAGVTPDRARSSLKRLRGIHPLWVLRGVRKWIRERREVRIYRADRSLALCQDEDPRIRCNSLADLMLFRPTESSQTRDEFLSTALTRLERGETAWTMRVNDRLGNCGWTAAVSEWPMTEVDQVLALPPGSVLLHDLDSAPGLGTPESYGVTVGHMLRAVCTDESRRYAYISLPADDRPARQVIEAMGFGYVGSFHWHRWFGRVNKWADPRLDDQPHA